MPPSREARDRKRSRQQQVAVLHARGRSKAEIAALLGVHNTTVGKDLMAVLTPPASSREAHAPLVLAALVRLEEALGKLSPSTDAAMAPVRAGIEHVRKQWSPCGHTHTAEVTTGPGNTVAEGKVELHEWDG